MAWRMKCCASRLLRAGTSRIIRPSKPHFATTDAMLNTVNASSK